MKYDYPPGLQDYRKELLSIGYFKALGIKHQCTHNNRLVDQDSKICLSVYNITSPFLANTGFVRYCNEVLFCFLNAAGNIAGSFKALSSSVPVLGHSANRIIQFDKAVF